jgi:hypothetical protein
MAGDREPSGQAATSMLGLRSVTGTNARSGTAWRLATEAGMDPHLGKLRIRRAPPGDLPDETGAIPCLNDDGEELVRRGLTANALDHGAQILDSGPPLGQQHRARGREQDPATGPVQQPDAELALQLADRRGQRGLCHAQALRGASEVQLLRYRDEVPELADLHLIHTSSVWNKSERVLPHPAAAR